MTDPAKIDRMEGHQFEYYCADLLRRNGYSNVMVTPGSGDQGVDILADRDDVSYAIQCKCYSGKVGNKAVQEAFSGRTYYDCDEAVVLTNSYFTEQAKDAARKTGVLLWDRNTLLALDRVAYPSNAAFNSSSRQTSSSGKQGGRAGCLSIIVFAVLIIGLIRLFSGGNSSKTEIANEVAPETAVIEQWVTPELDDFDYKYENGGILLKEYKGTATSIIIPASYEVEGTELQVLKLDGTFRNKKDLVNLVIPEGVEHVQYTTFLKTSSLKHLFLPSTMTGSETILEDFTDAEILYYGGTEEQWHALCYLTDRSEMSFKRIIFEANAEDCIENISTIVEESPGNINEIYAPLSEFEYDTAYGEITLGHYIGKRDIVYIAPAYYVDGELCPVVGLDNTFNSGKAVTTIIPEGVVSVTKATFNGSYAMTIFLPLSLTDVPEAFWGYFHDVDTIYYGGTEDDFKAICADRWAVDVKHVIYESAPEDLLAD